MSEISSKLRRTKNLKGKEGVSKIYKAINEAEEMNLPTHTSIVKTPTSMQTP